MSVISLRCGLYIRFAKGKEGMEKRKPKEGERERGGEKSEKMKKEKERSSKRERK